MNYCLQGHDRDNGVQEMLISLLPDEPHDRVEELSGDGCRSTAWEEKGLLCARAEIFRAETAAAMLRILREALSLPGDPSA